MSKRNLCEPGDGAFGYEGPEYASYGLTKREYFAAAALQGLLARDDGIHAERRAVAYADELIAALNEETES